jgi:phage-related tail fiber protein
MLFYCILTSAGRARLAAAMATGTPVALTQMGVGDGGGAEPLPTEAATALVNQRYRANLNSLIQNVSNPDWLQAEMVIPASIGGWFVREAGLFTSDGVLFAVANFPTTYKPVLSEGSGRELAIRIVVELVNTSAVTLVTDGSITLANQSFVTDGINAHAASRNHPYASETLPGFTRFSTLPEAIAGVVTDEAVTPAGVRAHTNAALGSLRNATDAKLFFLGQS